MAKKEYWYVVVDKRTKEIVAEGRCADVANKLMITQADLRDKVGKEYKYKSYWSNYIVGRTLL